MSALPDTASNTNGDAGYGMALTVYALFLLGCVTVVTVPFGLAFAVVSRADAAPWVRTHFVGQIRTIWYALAGAVIVSGAVILTIWLLREAGVVGTARSADPLASTILIATWMLWAPGFVLLRSVRGLLRLLAREPFQS